MMKMNGNRLNTWLILLPFLFFGGCTTTDTGLAPGVSSRLAKAERFFQQEKYAEAMIECIDLARRDPLMPGLGELEQKIVTKLADQRSALATRRASNTYKLMGIDVDNNKSIPNTYSLRRAIQGEKGSMRASPTSMQKALQKKVTVHLDGVNLDAFVMAIGASEGINIIADKLDNAKTMTVHAENVPLQEILDYVSRNLGVSFYVGENIIWATPKQSVEPGTPLLTRMYRLRKGISSEELADADSKINIVEAIERFVPKEEGTDLLFDRKAHVLIVRNTRDNLAKVEEIVDALDVCPPQVLIEARFITTAVSDLRELGIDWVLNSPIAVTQNKVMNNGVPGVANETQINPTTPNNIIGFTPFANSAQGMNFSYQGLLTDPMFQAVLHALETSGKSRTLSVPKVTTVNNRPAMIRIGEDFRYFEEYDVQSIPSSVSSAGAQLYSSVLVPVGVPVKEELGIVLNVTPSVGADMVSVMLHIVPEISEFVRYEYYTVGDSTSSGTIGTTNTTSMVKLPIFRRSKIETELIVQSGETVVMGGLISSTETKNQGKVPILGDIPLIGRLFRHDNIEETKQNLLIFVTANILSELGENLVPMIQEPEPAGN